MTVAQLIKQLQRYAPETPVHFGYDYGDRSHTTVAPEIRNVTESYVKHSEYHNMPAIVDIDYSEEAQEVDDAVIVLSA